MLTNGLFPEMQSAYREHHSTEPALLKPVKNDILMNMDMGHVTLLVLSAPPLIDFSNCSAYVGRLSNGFDPI